MLSAFSKCKVLGVDISLGTFNQHIELMAQRAATRKSSYVCCVNAHMTVEAQRDLGFCEIVNSAEFATADGMPIVKSLKWLCNIEQERVAGNDLMPALLNVACQQQLKVYFYGGTEEVLQLIRSTASREYPSLVIAGSYSPPFRALTDVELADTARRINDTGANIVLVSLGCPKQERWMAAMQNKVNALMVGVGGAFLLYAGHDTRAPYWMRSACLEWMHRLALEPQRLWKRYLVANTRFTAMFMRSWLTNLLSRFTNKQPTRYPN